jgi:hypothetical protein
MNSFFKFALNASTALALLSYSAAAMDPAPDQEGVVRITKHHRIHQKKLARKQAHKRAAQERRKNQQSRKAAKLMGAQLPVAPSAPVVVNAHMANPGPIGDLPFANQASSSSSSAAAAPAPMAPAPFSSSSSSSSSSSQNRDQGEQRVLVLSHGPASAGAAASAQANPLDPYAGYRHLAARRITLLQTLDSLGIPQQGVADLIHAYARPCFSFPPLNTDGTMPGMELTYVFKPAAEAIVTESSSGTPKPRHTYTANNTRIRHGDLEWHVDFTYDTSVDPWRSEPIPPAPALPTFDHRTVIGRDIDGNLCLFFSVKAEAYGRPLKGSDNERTGRRFVSVSKHARVFLPGFDAQGYQYERGLFIGNERPDLNPAMTTSLASLSFNPGEAQQVTIAQLRQFLTAENANYEPSHGNIDRDPTFQIGARRFRIYSRQSGHAGLDLLPDTAFALFRWNEPGASWSASCQVVPGLRYAENDDVNATRYREHWAKAVIDGAAAYGNCFDLTEVNAPSQSLASARGTLSGTSGNLSSSSSNSGSTSAAVSFVTQQGGSRSSSSSSSSAPQPAQGSPAGKK